MKVRILIIIGLVLVVGAMLAVLINHHNTIREFESNNTPDQLDGILGSCECQERVKTNPDTIERCPEPFIDWQNSTHYIDNNLCKWATSHQPKDISFDNFEERNLDGITSMNKTNCENQIHTNKPPEIYNVTPSDEGAIVRWYQTPQTINGEHCGFPEKYQIFVGLDFPIAPPFKFSDEIIHGGFRGDYKITGLESNTTYYVDVKGDWGAKIISSDIDMSFTTLSPGEILPAGNPVEKARDAISGNLTLQK